MDEPLSHLDAKLRAALVAGFIGSPAMNLARCRLDREDEVVLLTLGDHRWPLPKLLLQRIPPLSSGDSREVIFGLRPGALGLLEVSDSPDTPRISIAAISVESLGDEKNVLFLPPFKVPEVVADKRTSETELTSMWTARVAPDADIFTGQEVTLRLDLNQAYFFDADSGLSLQQAEFAAAA